MDEVVRRADYIVIAMPANVKAIGAIGGRELALIKPTFCLLNVARTEIVDEVALYDALARHVVAGAVLDVWYRCPSEPDLTAPATRPFHELPNLWVTQRVSGWTDGKLDARGKRIPENVARIARGDPPLNRVA